MPWAVTIQFSNQFCCFRFLLILVMSASGPSRQAAFFGPTVANGALRTLLDLQLAPAQSRLTHGNTPDQAYFNPLPIRMAA